MLFFLGGRFSPFWILFFFRKIQFLINFETLQIHSKRAEYEFHKKMKTRFVWAIPYGIQGLKIMKIKYVTKNWHYSACIGFNTWKNVSFGKNEKSEASFYWDSPYVCVWREALELECLTFYCLTGRWMFYHCSLEWSAPFLIFASVSSTSDGQCFVWYTEYSTQQTAADNKF